MSAAPALADLRLTLPALVTAAALSLGLLGSWTRPADPRLIRTGPQDAIAVWVVDNGFHSDLILPRDRLDDGRGPLAQAVRSLPPGDWVAVGWGDADFYTDARPISDRLPDGARAFLRPGNPSVVLLDPLDDRQYAGLAASTAHPLTLSHAGFLGLRGRLERSLETDGGAPIAGPPSQVGDGRFFKSVETFWVGHLCNHWAGELLHAGGLAVRPFRTIFSAEIVRMAHSASETSGAPG